MASKLSVAEYMRDVALTTLVGPYALLWEGPSTLEGASRGDYKPAVRTVAVAGGSLAYSYAALQLLNYVQGPKYALSFPELMSRLNPARNLGVKAAITNPAAIITATAGGMFAATAAYPHVAGPMYQSAATGQPGIGSAGHDLIFGKMTWDNFW